MDIKEAQRELIKIAADLLLRNSIPSDLVDDYPQKTYAASRVAGMMEPAHRQIRFFAVRIRTIADSIDNNPDAHEG